ncbi:hypothetical protein AGLY_000083 [Aphis glycines]|uniref:Major facilitator superfamily (MFS) profile domain-containing protein n=1 Tax=Aphis glycines TaxID=307491 RepID=A0A6G0U8D1_APHGL|nr:hypothetical protein AGLY_000083 [Aphis glycines]
MEKSTNIDFYMDHLGDFGSYQLRQFLLNLMSAFTAGLHMMVLVTVAAVPEYKCLIPELESESNITNWIVAPKFNNDSCQAINTYNQTVNCEKWIFNETYYGTTRATQWNMICDNRWMGSLAQMSYMFGVFTGSVVLGSLADKLIDESPRWLWGQGRKEEAIKIIQKALKTNNKTMPILLEKEQMVSLNNDEPVKESNQNRSFAASFGYYGISLRTGNLPGNPYFMLFVMAAVEIPSYIFVTLSMDRMGRRFLSSSMMIVGGTALLISAFFPSDPLSQSISTGIVFLGKFCIAGAFAIIYNYTVERFPTVVRNTAIGLGSMFARLAGGFTPLVTLLDSYDARAPAITFALVTLISGVLSTLLPETLNTIMPQTMEDGEEFGKGDTCFTTGCFGRKKKPQPKKKEIPVEESY